MIASPEVIQRKARGGMVVGEGLDIPHLEDAYLGSQVTVFASLSRRERDFVAVRMKLDAR
jgi:hypothetical protein